MTHIEATHISFMPLIEAMMPIIKDIAPAIGELVASIIAGKVMTARVT